MIDSTLSQLPSSCRRRLFANKFMIFAKSESKLFVSGASVSGLSYASEG